jgi:phenylalanine-4-hydroxylase
VELFVGRGSRARARGAPPASDPVPAKPTSSHASSATRYRCRRPAPPAAELLGHAVMFADPDFADFSHEIGLASLGASDAAIKKLATCYWFSVEFGLALDGAGQRKAYGAGLLSSFGELEYACAPYRPAGGVETFPEYRPWEPAAAAEQAYPITSYQPVYFVAESLADAKARMRAYCERLDNKGFTARYDPYTQSVAVDRAVVRGQYSVTLQTGAY